MLRKLENIYIFLYLVKWSLKELFVLENMNLLVVLVERIGVDSFFESLYNDIGLYFVNFIDFLFCGIFSDIVSLWFEVFNVVDDFEIVCEKVF